MNPQNLNSKTYEIVPSNSNGRITLDAPAAEGTNVILTNTSDKVVFVSASTNVSDTTTFPTSQSTPVLGQIVPVGAVMSYELNKGDKYLNCIHADAGGSGSLFATVGAGV